MTPPAPGAPAPIAPRDLLEGAIVVAIGIMSNMANTALLSLPVFWAVHITVAPTLPWTTVFWGLMALRALCKTFDAGAMNPGDGSLIANFINRLLTFAVLQTVIVAIFCWLAVP